MKSPTRERAGAGFGSLWAASTVSAFGSYVTSLAVGVLVVLTLDGGATEVGIVNAARWAPYLLVGLMAGVLVDRVRRRPVLVAGDLGRAVLLAAVPVLAAYGALTITALAALMAAFGLFSVVYDAAFQSYVPRVVTGSLTRANARLDQSDAVAQASGPALAGGLVSWLGAPLAVLVDAASFLVSGLLLARIRAPEPAPGRLRARGVRRELAEGLRWVYRHRTLRPHALGTHSWFLANSVAGAVVAPYALLELGLSPFALGLALAAAGAGALIGSLAAVRAGERYGAGLVSILAQGGSGVAFAVVALAPGWWLFALGQLLYGLSLGFENANSLGYRQAITPDRLQARTNATIRSVNRAVIVVGAPLGGLLGDALGFRPVLGAAAALFVLVAAATALTPYRTARVPPERAG